MALRVYFEITYFYPHVIHYIKNNVLLFLYSSDEQFHKKNHANFQYVKDAAAFKNVSKDRPIYLILKPINLSMWNIMLFLRAAN